MCVTRVHQGCQREARRENKEGAGGKPDTMRRVGAMLLSGVNKDKGMCLKRSPEHEVQAPSPLNYGT